LRKSNFYSRNRRGESLNMKALRCSPFVLAFHHAKSACREPEIACDHPRQPSSISSIYCVASYGQLCYHYGSDCLVPTYNDEKAKVLSCQKNLLVAHLEGELKISKELWGQKFMSL